MNRNGKLLFITHLYPIATVLHMQYGDWCLRCKLINAILPVLFIFAILQVWQDTSSIKLSWIERQHLAFFKWCFFCFHFYYGLCAYVIATATSKGQRDSYNWINGHNHFIFYFSLLTTIFYIFIYVHRKWRQ